MELDADFGGAGDNAHWDSHLQYDLGTCAGIDISFEMKEARSCGLMSFGFHSSQGWSTRYWRPDKDGQISLHLSKDSFENDTNTFRWNDIDGIRVNMWGNTAGKAGIVLKSIKTFGNEEDVNWVKNGGFEWVSDDLPVAWGTGLWGIGASPWVSDSDAFTGSYAIDEKEAAAGTRCLRLTNVGNAPFAYSCWMSPPSDWRYRLSLKMKSSVPMHVRVEYSGTKKEFEITSAWSEYAIDDLAPSARSRIGIFPLERGVLWVDSVSLMTEGKTRNPGYSALHPDDGTAYLPSTSSILDRLPGEQAYASSDKTMVQPIMSLGFESIPSKATVQRTAELGFSHITAFVPSSAKPEAVRELLDNAASAGISVVVWLDKRMDLSTIQNIVSAYGKHGSLTAWYVWDEPIGSDRPKIEARIQAIKSLDPNHAVLAERPRVFPRVCPSGRYCIYGHLSYS